MSEEMMFNTAALNALIDSVSRLEKVSEQQAVAIHTLQASITDVANSTANLNWKFDRLMTELHSHIKYGPHPTREEQN